MKWKRTDTGVFYGHDSAGNSYTTPANRETVRVRLTDGREGYGWTVEQAYENACLRPQTEH